MTVPEGGGDLQERGTGARHQTLGLVGGIGPESTIDYYRRLIGRGAKSIVIYSVDLDRVLGFWSRDDLDGAASYLADGVARVASAGASVAGIAANTPHIVFDRVLARSPIPLVSIVEATCTHAQGRGCRRVGLLGTETTMKGRFYPEVFDRQGIEVVAPPDTDQPMVHHIYVDELVKGIFKDESRTRLESLISRWSRTEHLDAVILGGTELPLILREPQVDGVSLIDTTAVHVEALIAAAP